ncbi:hypothetical protein PPERSA_06874 [Pseudocohnilembus persalinus]|uniref:Wntless-like transmembrane domain-containing protein n=1 Tax=Pseudocohnilembus persalinus TaxID=266149 RepID=A0A0V0QTI7_PSEPJ|nr:hypothetical protein PPERSA_06874 [Pseudocohnilembus persalinus]|eukprot:KRX05240.1 hypothetical protein PPERSA_06874 [Pseudocohnilembus persalinus]
MQGQLQNNRQQSHFQNPQLDIEDHENPVVTRNSPQLIKIMADNESNKRILCHWVSFFVLILFFYLMTFAVPDAIEEYTPQSLDSDSCPDNIQENFSYLCQDFSADNPEFGMVKFDLDKKNQFLIAELQFTRLGSENFSQKIQYQYSYYSIDKSYNVNEEIKKEKESSFTVKCDGNNSDNSSSICEANWVIYIKDIKYDNVLLDIKFKNMDEWVDKMSLTSATFIYIRSQYTDFLIATKYSFMALSIVTFVLFYMRLKKLDKIHWIIEQKFILILSILLIFFNDPFYAITILEASPFMDFLSVFFIINFLVTVFIFWIIALKRIVEDNARKATKSFNIKLIIFGFVSWIFLIITYCGFSYEVNQDPGVDFYESFKTGYEVFKWFGIILISVFFLYIIYNYIQIARNFKSRIWRHRLFSVFSIYFIFCMAVFLYSGTPNIYNYYGGRVLLFISILNMYLCYLQYMYSPSNVGLQEAQQNKYLEENVQNQHFYDNLDESQNIEEYNFPQQEQLSNDIQINQINGNTNGFQNNNQVNKNSNNNKQFQIDDDDDDDDI